VRPPGRHALQLPRCLGRRGQAVRLRVGVRRVGRDATA
jgi:hypothetical protein